MDHLDDILVNLKDTVHNTNIIVVHLQKYRKEIIYMTLVNSRIVNHV